LLTRTFAKGGEKQKIASEYRDFAEKSVFPCNLCVLAFILTTRTMKRQKIFAITRRERPFCGFLPFYHETTKTLVH